MTVMLISIFTIPAVILLSGLFLYKYPPEEINGTYGFRARRSSQTIFTLRYANARGGKLLFAEGVLMFALMLIALLIMHWVFGISDPEQIGLYLSLFAVILLIVGIIYLVAKVHRELREKFDANGMPINPDGVRRV